MDIGWYALMSGRPIKMKSPSQDIDAFPAITSKVAFFMHPGNAWALNPRLKTSARGIVKQSWNT